MLKNTMRHLFSRVNGDIINGRAATQTEKCVNYEVKKMLP